MNNKVYIVDRNGNQIIAEGISYITLKGDGFSNDYLFYTLNELVNGDLNKIYVAKVSEVDKNITDEEWDNVKRVMLAITHGETVEGMSYNSIFDEKGEGKSFNVDIPRKIAIKLDKLTGLRDNYKLAITNPNRNANVAAVGNPENVVTTEVVSETPAIPEVKVEETQAVPTAPVAATPTQPVQPEPTVVAQPEVTTTVVEETKPVTTEVVTEVKETKPMEEIQSISPMPIPDVVLEDKKEDSFAIPVNNKVTPSIEDNDIFNEIIKELKDIRTQNDEIKESIRKLTNNIANINTSLSSQEIKQAQGNYDGMINTNMANTTEDVSAIDITSNGTVVIPSFEQAQKSAVNSANVISNNIIDTTVSAPIVETPAVEPVIVQQSTAPVAAPVVEETPVPANPIESLATSPVETPTAPVVPETPAVQEPAVAPVAPAPVQEPAVAAVPELPQILPDVPMTDEKTSATNPNIIIPEFDPNAGLPPVQMPTGVSAGDDSSAVGSTIAG